LNVELPQSIDSRTSARKPQGDQTPATIGFVVLLLCVIASVDSIETPFITMRLFRLIDVNDC
jgi:hypothetical protein